MLVNDCMTRHPIMISPDMLASEAQQLMTENNIRHLPVVGPGKKLVGLITRSSFALTADILGSLNVWEISRRLSNVQIKNLMLKEEHILTTRPDMTVERAANIIAKNKIGCLPVIAENIVVGIITETDMLTALQEMLGLPADGVRVTVRIPNRAGEFAKLMTTLGQQGWGVMGIGTYPTRRDESKYDVVIKIPNIGPDEVRAVLSQVPDQEMIDIRNVV